MPWIWQSSAWPNFWYDAQEVASDLASASQAIGEITGMQAGLSASEREELQLRRIVQEALGSFGIEGVTLDRTQLEVSVVASLLHRERNAFDRRSDAIATLLLRARDHHDPVSAETLCEWHRLLFFRMEVDDPGRWRQSDIEIVRSAVAGTHEVLFKAPPPERLNQEMSRLLAWMATEHVMPVSIKAAIAHLWFETIHPFADGNGRIGRALIDNVFAQQNALPFSLSRQIEMEKRAYYEALQAGRHEDGDRIDATAFVTWFLQCLCRAAQVARQEAQFLLARNAFFIRHSAAMSQRQEAVMRKIFEAGPKRVAEGISARSYARISGASGPTATRDLNALVAIGVLSRSEAGGRSTAYTIRL
ncbi:Fic family protein [Paracoccus laeviglucosivorans]|uniref:Fic family protein n=1 Tax=Paracoccus laeviglucosivorans TaxID=1197861 RepID=A0A521FN85_9RHOB|nr:DUF4172 domain-containing protein [Paracoccus laeviglucosivorans]SMO97586.1 Fic family protein [Paracoccus laeviglucosivorans]